MTDLVTFTEGQIDLIKRTICTPKDREATTDELALFIGQAKRTGLDPFSRQIYAMFRKSRGVEKMTIQVAIDGFRLIAERSGHYLGQSGPFWSDKDGQWSEIWPKSKGLPVASKVVVRKLIGGQVAETSAVAHWDEYAVYYNGQPSDMWAGKPALMLAKCAEALALRKAFPNDLSGLYTAEEMSRADVPAEPAYVASTAVQLDRPGIVSQPPVERLSDVTDALPWEDPAPPVIEAEAKEDDPMPAFELMAEIKARGGMNAATFREFAGQFTSEVPSDLASAEKRQAFLASLPSAIRVEIAQALVKRAQEPQEQAA